VFESLSVTDHFEVYNVMIHQESTTGLGRQQNNQVEVPAEQVVEKVTSSCLSLP
jgi:hypothetical protein